VDENLTEEERKRAWEEFEQEKKGFIQQRADPMMLQQMQSLNPMAIQAQLRAMYPEMSHEEVMARTRWTITRMQQQQLQQRGNREEQMEESDINYGPTKAGQGFSSRGGVMQVRCKSVPALLHVNRYESGSKGKCIQVQPPHTLVEEWLTPNEYEEKSGSKAKDYLSSIKCLGRPLKDYVHGGELRGSGPAPSPKLPYIRHSF